MAKRRDLFDPTDPASLQPEQRLTEVAAILAAGVIRMRARHAATVAKIRPVRKRVGSTGSASPPPDTLDAKISLESGENCLELSRRSGPDSPCG
ncbi:MAG: hypothetical protein IID33_15205 [Planctomycetes bacterium]|nr:hypothetical protein [Planctomycetota bacterium]